jgi:putative membrane protein
MTMTVIRSHLLVAGSTIAGAAALLLAAGPAAAAATSGPSSQDTSYIASNAQTNLAEVALATIVLDRSQNPQSRELATMTMNDHQQALQQLNDVADQLGVPVPATPNADQQRDAATLTAAAATDFDATYAQIQVKGHQLSIAATNSEISSGSDPSVISYAQRYLPVATKHLQMAQNLLTATGGRPGAVPAGTGGLAGTSGTARFLVEMALIPVGVGLLVTGWAGLVRRRARSR